MWVSAAGQPTGGAVVGVTCEVLSGPTSSFVTPAMVSEVFLGGGAASFSQNPQPSRYLPLSRDPGILFLHPPYQDCAGHSTAPQLLLGPYTGTDLWGRVGIQGEGGAGVLLVSFN